MKYQVKFRDSIKILFIVSLFIQIGCINFLEKSLTSIRNKNADFDNKILTKEIYYFENPGILNETPTIVKQSDEASIPSIDKASDIAEETERNPLNTVQLESNQYERPTYYSSVIEDHPVDVTGGTNGFKGLVTMDLPSTYGNASTDFNAGLSPSIQVNPINEEIRVSPDNPNPTHAQQVNPNNLMAHNLIQSKDFSPLNEISKFLSTSSQARSNESQTNLGNHVENHELIFNPGVIAHKIGGVSSSLSQIQNGSQGFANEFALNPAIPENKTLLMQHHILKIPDFNFSFQNTMGAKEENNLNAINQNSSILLDLNQKSFKKMKKFMKQTKFILESFKEELLEENLDLPLKHKVEIENEFESIIQNENVIQNIYISDLPMHNKEAHNKFIINSESLKTFFEKEN